MNVRRKYRQKKKEKKKKKKKKRAMVYDDSPDPQVPSSFSICLRPTLTTLAHQL